MDQWTGLKQYDKQTDKLWTIMYRFLTFVLAGKFAPNHDGETRIRIHCHVRLMDCWAKVSLCFITFCISLRLSLSNILFARIHTHKPSPLQTQTLIAMSLALALSNPRRTNSISAAARILSGCSSFRRKRRHKNGNMLAYNSAFKAPRQL